MRNLLCAELKIREAGRIFLKTQLNTRNFNIRVAKCTFAFCDDQLSIIIAANYYNYLLTMQISSLLFRKVI